MSSNHPKFSRCDSCGRRTHKVAVSYPTKRTHYHNHPVFGYCPKCVAGMVDSATRDGKEWPTDFDNGVVLYDRRGSNNPPLVSAS